MCGFPPTSPRADLVWWWWAVVGEAALEPPWWGEESAQELVPVSVPGLAQEPRRARVSPQELAQRRVQVRLPRARLPRVRPPRVRSPSASLLPPA